MATRREYFTDEQWSLISPIITPSPIRADGKGRPREHSDRDVMNGVMWVLRTGAAWMDLLDRFPSGATCFRRFSVWVKAGVMRQILETLAKDLENRGDIDLSECFIDGTFVVAKKGGSRLERPSGARVRSSWLLLTLMVFHPPCTRLLLALMKSPLSKLPSIKPTPWDDPDDLPGIVPMTVIRSIKGSR